MILSTPSQKNQNLLYEFQAYLIAKGFASRSPMICQWLKGLEKHHTNLLQLPKHQQVSGYLGSFRTDRTRIRYHQQARQALNLFYGRFLPDQYSQKFSKFKSLVDSLDPVGIVVRLKHMEETGVHLLRMKVSLAQRRQVHQRLNALGLSLPKLHQFLNSMSLRDQILWRLFAGCGIQLHEAIRIRIGDLRNLRDSAGVSGANTVLVIRDADENVQRVVPVPRGLAIDLCVMIEKRCRQYQRDMQMHHHYTIIQGRVSSRWEHQYLFVNKRFVSAGADRCGRLPCTTSAIQKSLRKSRDVTGLVADVMPQTMRRNYASTLYEAGLSKAKICELTGMKARSLKTIRQD